jgi:molybdopterin adenylyltransferase
MMNQWDLGGFGVKHDYQAAVVTVSDSTAAGTRVDESGERLSQLLTAAGFHVVHREVQPDEQSLIVNTLKRLAASHEIDCVLTTGGTGASPRDVTPEATLDVLEKTLPGIPEAMRAASLGKTPFAMIARQVAGIRNGTLIVNLPGSVKAVAECFAVIEPVLKHVIDITQGKTDHASRES